ncbi:hypothetical protein [Nannocystis pusilla]|uniref:hypothetical protein n=1 Tax=Nannocystis pusilla TaxID=889268 RepID=UPI003B7B943D
MKTVVEPFDEFHEAEPAVWVSNALLRPGAAEGRRERSAASFLGDPKAAARPRPLA